MLYKIQYLNSI